MVGERIVVELRKANHYYFEGETTAFGSLSEEMEPGVEQRASTMQELDFLTSKAHEAYRRERYVLSKETASSCVRSTRGRFRSRSRMPTSPSASAFVRGKARAGRDLPRAWARVSPAAR